MPGVLIFPTNNNAIVNTRFVKVRGKIQSAPVEDPSGKRKPLQPGTCAAQSVMWARMMLDGKDPEKTCPKAVVAGVLQSAYVRAADADLMKTLMTGSGLRLVGNPVKLSPASVTAHTCDNPAVYLVFTKRHAFAVKTTEDNFYYFEPEEGLWHFTVRPEFRRKIHGNFVAEAGDDSNRWSAYELAIG
jgi:hypothetical protein